MCGWPRDDNSTSVRELSEMVPVSHLYSGSFGCPSAERKVEEFETETGACHSMSLNLLSQGKSLLIYKELSWLILLAYNPRKEERD